MLKNSINVCKPCTVYNNLLRILQAGTKNNSHLIKNLFRLPMKKPRFFCAGFYCIYTQSILLSYIHVLGGELKKFCAMLEGSPKFLKNHREAKKFDQILVNVFHSLLSLINDSTLTKTYFFDEQISRQLVWQISSQTLLQKNL